MSDNLNLPNQTFHGISVSEGIGFGKIIIYRTDFDDVTEYTIEQENIANEINRYSDALNEVNLIFLNNQKHVAREIGLDNAKIYETYHLILEDPFFQEEIPESIRSEKKNAEHIICSKLVYYEKHFSAVKDEYLRERMFDIRGVSRRLIYHLLQGEHPAQMPTEEENIIVARELTPADSIHFHHKSLKGLITEFGGRTSHAAILARSLEVPAIVGVKDLLKKVTNHNPAILDGSEGTLIVNPNKEKKDFYGLKQQQHKERTQFLIRSLEVPIKNLPNRKIKLMANINEPSEIDLAIKYKADGVGLFRTELAFIAKEHFLNEEEQFEIYKKLVSQFEKKEVVIRVLDLGGDKFLPFVDLHRESNPFLGWRSIRILLMETDIFKTQLRAIFRASAFGNARILIPMISSREEVMASKKIIDEVKSELISENIKFNPNIPVGVMIEIPSAAIALDSFIDEIDFISIGTNDLIQYTLAVDRNNEKVASFYQPLNPGVLQLIKIVVASCKKKNKPCSVCGEMAGDPLYAQLLLSLGINDFSMQPVSIPRIKNIVLNTQTKRLNQIRKKIDSCYSVTELHEFLSDFN